MNLAKKFYVGAGAFFPTVPASVSLGDFFHAVTLLNALICLRFTGIPFGGVRTLFMEHPVNTEYVLKFDFTVSTYIVLFSLYFALSSVSFRSFLL